jgi:hypothetical protein
LTLAELSKQLYLVRESLRNMNFQFLEAIQTVNVSNMSSTSDFFCQLGVGAGHFVTNSSPC